MKATIFVAGLAATLCLATAQTQAEQGKNPNTNQATKNTDQQWIEQRSTEQPKLDELKAILTDKRAAMEDLNAQIAAKLEELEAADDGAKKGLREELAALRAQKKDLGLERKAAFETFKGRRDELRFALEERRNALTANKALKNPKIEELNDKRAAVKKLLAQIKAAPKEEKKALREQLKAAREARDSVKAELSSLREATGNIWESIADLKAQKGGRPTESPDVPA